MTRNEAESYRKKIELAASMMDDTSALSVVELFPVWHENTSYSTGQRLRHEGLLYKVLQDHVSQPDWSPNVAVSLFAKVLISESSAIIEWEQPDSTNPYMLGDKVAHNGGTWVSDINNNVWEPGVFGWSLIEE